MGKAVGAGYKDMIVQSRKVNLDPVTGYDRVTSEKDMCTRLRLGWEDRCGRRLDKCTSRSMAWPKKIRTWGNGSVSRMNSQLLATL